MKQPRGKRGRFAKTHGSHGTNLYMVWSAMMQRCNNTHKIDYKLYGGKGIRVCVRWRNFDGFLEDIGAAYNRERRNHGSVRIVRKDKKKGYTPGNVKVVPVQWR